MRLLFVHEKFGALAGAEVNAWLTASALGKHGHSIGILHGPSTGKNVSEWEEAFPERFLLAARRASEITHEAVEQFAPDVIYVHKMSAPNVLKALLDCGRPIVRMVHDHELYCMRGYKYHPLSRKICCKPASLSCLVPCGAMVRRNRGPGWPLRWVSYLAKRKELRLNRRFDRLIVASDYMRIELLRNGFDPNRMEVHAPVPPSPDVVLESSFSARNRLVYAGQIIRGKGVDILLEALAQVRTQFTCVILGEGNHRDYCQDLCRKLGLADRVAFMGYVPPEQLPAYYAEASVAVMSSVWPEPFGAVGLEAMRYGLPVVAFDAGAIREWMIDGATGFLVPRMHRAQFAARIEQLLADKALARRMGARGRKLASEKYSFERYIEGLETMFGRVLNQARATRTTKGESPANHADLLVAGLAESDNLMVAEGDTPPATGAGFA